MLKLLNIKTGIIFLLYISYFKGQIFATRLVL
jgi:hypothetical protein